jgi:hypothetical protein
MINCKNCKQWPLCKIHANIDKETTQGLRTQILSAHKGKKISESWRAVFGGLARTCHNYEYMFQKYLDELLANKELVKYLDNYVLELKKNKDLIEELLSDSYPEYKIEVIHEFVELDLDEDNEEFNKLVTDDDSWDSILYYINSKFGF